MSSTVAYLKPTNYCNVDCEHCYLSEEVRANKSFMSDEKLREVYEFIRSIRDKKGESEAHIIWHGGEPLMLTPEWYENACEMAHEVFGEKGVSMSIQTSLIPFSPKWAKVMHKYFDGYVGTSIDFKSRKVRGSNEKYLELWMKRVEAARKEGLGVSPIMVPSRSELGHADKVIDWVMDHGFYALNIDRFTIHKTKNIEWPTNSEHSQFLIDMFEHCLKRLSEDKNAPYINAVVAGIMGVFYGYSGDRWGTTCQKSYIVIEPDGSLNSCPDRTSVEDPFSNISDGPDAFMRSKARRSWIRITDVTHKKTHCYSCRFSSFCKSGCPIMPNESKEQCSGYHKFLEHVEAYKNDPIKHKQVLQYLEHVR